jgi:hypothetical protein
MVKDVAMMPQTHNKFSFYPVGQGLFYSGSLYGGEYNFVFDCGSDNYTPGGYKYLLNWIDKYVQSLNSKQIDFVCISHLDYDHIYGLISLKKKAIINKIFLPYIHHDSIDIILWLIFSRNGGVNNPLYTEFREIINNDNVCIFVGSEEQEDDLSIARGEKYLNASQGNWHFKMFNKSISNKKFIELNDEVKDYIKAKGKTKLEELTFDDVTIKDLQKLFDKHVYDTIHKRNISSTILIHYPNDLNEYSFFCDSNNGFCQAHRKCCKYFWYYYKSFGAITVLTGDAVFDDQMQNKVDTILKKKAIYILQAPHHGARDNWKLLNKIKFLFDIYIIPFGYGNRHKHPYYRILDELLIEKKCIHSVTQIDWFSYMLKLSI